MKLRAGVEALFLPSLEGEHAQTAQYLQWAADQRRLQFRVSFETRMPQYCIKGLGWRNCASLDQLPWKLPTRECRSGML